MKWPAWLNPARLFRGSKRDLTYGDLLRKGWVGGSPAGVPVTERTALGISAVFCASRVIAEDLATFPKVVYRGRGEGAKPLPDDPVAKLLARPNPEETAPVFWASYQHNANLWGFAAAEIVRDGFGEPVELWLVPSPEWRLDRVAGRLTFEAPAAGGGRTRLDPDNVLFLPGLSPDASLGYRLLEVARMTLGTSAAAQEFAAASFKNGISPSGLIKHPGVLSTEAAENMRRSWAALHGGPSNARVPMILEEGTDWKELVGSQAEQLQLAQLSEFQVVEVARYFNISPVKLHQLGRATWGNLETLNRDHVHTCLGPWIAKHDAEIGVKLLRTEATGRACRHVTDRLLIADTDKRFAAWASALTAGWMTPNEVRAREDLPPIEGGDELHRPLNQGPAGVGDASPPSPEDDKPTPPAPEGPPDA